METEAGEGDGDLSHLATLPRLNCRVTNYEPGTSLKNLKANYYGKILGIYNGTVSGLINVA